jgi:capsular exopolysaccharide synthesis family protein
MVVASVRNEYELAKKLEENLPLQIEEQKRQALDLDDRASTYAELEREVAQSRGLLERLESRQKETELAAALPTKNIRIVDKAEVPRAPVGPDRFRSLAMALLVGLMGGAGLVFFIEYLDRSVKDPGDLERLLNVPFLGPVPVIEAKKEGPLARDLISAHEPKSLYAEAYRSLRTGVFFTSPDNPPKVLMVTSTGPQEGKTVTTINLALAIAASGKKVLLVDADMRKPRVHKVFGQKNSVGLSTLLGGEKDVGLALKETKVANLTVITSGQIPPNPSELLGTERMVRFLGILRERFDIVLIDSPPLISITDSVVLGSHVDGVILVAKAGATSREILKRGIAMLGEVNASIVGVVLNMVDYRKSTYYYHSHYYSYYYGEDSNGKGKRRGRKEKMAGGKKGPHKKVGARG